MLFKLNSLGILNSRSMAEFSADKCNNNYNPFPSSVLHNIRRYGSDYIYDKCWIQDIVKIMQPDEILLVTVVDDSWLLQIATFLQSQKAYQQWCLVNNLIPKQAHNLTRFIKEVRVIWQD